MSFSELWLPSVTMSITIFMQSALISASISCAACSQISKKPVRIEFTMKLAVLLMIAVLALEVSEARHHHRFPRHHRHHRGHTKHGKELVKEDYEEPEGTGGESEETAGEEKCKEMWRIKCHGDR
eukprot:241466_1